MDGYSKLSSLRTEWCVTTVPRRLSRAHGHGAAGSAVATRIYTATVGNSLSMTTLSATAGGGADVDDGALSG